MYVARPWPGWPSPRRYMATWQSGYVPYFDVWSMIARSIPRWLLTLRVATRRLENVGVGPAVGGFVGLGASDGSSVGLGPSDGLGASDASSEATSDGDCDASPRAAAVAPLEGAGRDTCA